MCVCLVADIWLFVTSWTVARQVSLPMGILQARLLEWVAMPSSRESSQPGGTGQGLNPGLLHCWWILYCLSHQGSPWTLEWVACPFSRGSSRPKDQTRSLALQADSLPAELPGKPISVWVYIYPNHFAIHLKLTHYCKSTVLHCFQIFTQKLMHKCSQKSYS